MLLNKNPLIIRITTVPLSFHKLLRGQMRYMQDNGFAVHLVSSPGPQTEAVMVSENCGLTSISMTRTISPLQDLISLFRLCILFFKLKPSIVHTHTPKAGFLGMFAACIVGVPVKLHTIAGLPWTESKGIKRKILKQVERLTIYFSTRIYVNSLNLVTYINNQGIDSIPTKLKVLGNGSSNGIDTNYFSRQNTDVNQIKNILNLSRIREGGFIWLFVGRIVKEKGITELVEAFLKVKKMHPSDQLWLVGPFEKKDSIDLGLVAIIEKEENIITWGYKEDVRPFFAAAGSLVFPSYREGFPNVPMQAAAMECPMILSNINGCNEIVKDKVNGMLVPAKNISALTNAMFFIRSEPILRKYFTDRSLDIVKEKYCNKELWPLLKADYNELLILNKK